VTDGETSLSGVQAMGAHKGNQSVAWLWVVEIVRSRIYATLPAGGGWGGGVVQSRRLLPKMIGPN